MHRREVQVEKHGQYPNADLYQMAAYCRRFGLGEGWLVYAAGETIPVEMITLLDGPVIRRSAVALKVPSTRILHGMSLMARHVATSNSSTTTPLDDRGTT